MKCPCGAPAGPKFRYGLCDECADNTPASALILMGRLAGQVHTYEQLWAATAGDVRAMIRRALPDNNRTP